MCVLFIFLFYTRKMSTNYLLSMGLHWLSSYFIQGKCQIIIGETQITNFVHISKIKLLMFTIFYGKQTSSFQISTFHSYFKSKIIHQNPDILKKHLSFFQSVYDSWYDVNYIQPYILKDVITIPTWNCSSIPGCMQS